jgi:hypothetical protein
MKRIKRLMASLSAMIALPILTFAPMVRAAASTVVVSGNTSSGENQPGWMFNRDSTAPYEFNEDQASIGEGSLYVKPIGSTPSEKFVAENFINTPIAGIDSISYDFQIGDGGSASQANQFYMNVYANFGSSPDDKFYDCRYNVVPTVGSTTDFTTVTFDPTQAYDVTTRSSSPFACPAVPADMDLSDPGSTIRAFALNVGDSSASDAGVSGYLDKVVVTSANGDVVTYDFEQTPTVLPNKEACKNGGWMKSDIPEFKNQGDCVSYFASNGKAKGNPTLSNKPTF